MIKFITDKKHRQFFRFWFAQLISQFGDRVHQMALVGLIAQRAPGSSFELAKLLAFTIIPVFVIGPIAGVMVDRWDRKATLIVCDIVRGVLVLAIALWAMDLKDLWPLYILVFLIFTFSRFHVPAKLSLIPEMVETPHLHMANSLITMTGMIAFVGGVVCGGLLVEHLGSRGGFICDAFTYFISAAFIISMAAFKRIRENLPKVGEAAAHLVDRQKGLWRDMKEGIIYIGQQKAISMIFILMTVLFAAAGAIYVVIIVFVQNAFGTITKDLGFLSIPLGGGLLIGSLIYAKWGEKIGHMLTIFISLLLAGISIFAFTFIVLHDQNRMIAGVLALFIGLTVGPSIIASNTVINQTCAKEMSGKVFAALECVMHLAFLLSMLICSHLADIISHASILMGVSVLFAFVGLGGVLFQLLLKLRRL